MDPPKKILPLTVIVTEPKHHHQIQFVGILWSSFLSCSQSCFEKIYETVEQNKLSVIPKAAVNWSSLGFSNSIIPHGFIE